jgi:hypothetical protein
MKTLDLATMENIQGGTGGCNSCGGINISVLLGLTLGGCGLLGLGLGVGIRL